MNDPILTLPEPVDFLGCPLRPLTTSEFIGAVTYAAEQAERLRIAYLNAHTSNLAARDSEYRALLRQCDILYADGQAVVWAARLLGRPVPERVNAGDFATDFMHACAARDLRLYLLGGRPGVADRAARAWSAHTPDLRIVGTQSGFFPDDDAPAAARRIREARADVLLVGMGSPRQEQWMAHWGDETGATVIWCVGALFEYHAGGRARAPRWMRRAGLEWLFRLALEPARLWRRYLLGNAVFIARVLRARRRQKRA